GRRARTGTRLPLPHAEIAPSARERGAAPPGTTPPNRGRAAEKLPLTALPSRPRRRRVSRHWIQVRNPSSDRSFLATFSASARPAYGPTLTRRNVASAPLPEEIPTGYPLALRRLLIAVAAAASRVAITWM